MKDVYWGKKKRHILFDISSKRTTSAIVRQQDVGVWCCACWHQQLQGHFPWVSHQRQLNPLLWVAPHTTSSKTLWLSVSHGPAVHRVLEGSWHCSTTLSLSVTWLCLWLFSQLCACSSLPAEDYGLLGKACSSASHLKDKSSHFFFCSCSCLLGNEGKVLFPKIHRCNWRPMYAPSIFWSRSLPPRDLPQTSVLCDTHHVLPLIIIVGVHILHLLFETGNMTY